MKAKDYSKPTRKSVPDREAASRESGDWSMRVVRRSDAPPLRFKGREIARFLAPSEAHPGTVALWQRKSGGYVALLEFAGRERAVSVATLDEAMGWLEGLSASHDGVCNRAQTTVSMSSVISNLVSHRHLRLLTGDALDQWESVVLHATQAPAEERHPS